MLLLAAAWLALAPVARSQSIVQSYFVPFSEDDVHLALNTIDDFGGNIGSTLRSTISIVAGVTNTVLYWDHWEDGYETSVTTPTQATTQVWGDLNPANGMPPGFATDRVGAGDIITLLNDISVPRDPAELTYDGRDKFSVTRWVAVSRAMHATSPGEVLAGSAQVYNRGDYGFVFRAPVGINVGSNEMFEYATMLVQAGYDATVVNIDADNDGSYEAVEFLDQGDTLAVRFVSLGATINATKPVQCHMVTGDIGSNYEMRWFTLFPARQWGTSYFTPVGSASTVPSEVYLFNPNASPMQVLYETYGSTGSLAVASHAVTTFEMPQGSGGRFWSTNGAPFIAVEAVDARQSASGNQAYDWGHGMVSDKMLTSMTLVPWGPGSGGTPISQNGNPLWVTAVSNTTLYIDYDADPDTGALVDPLGRHYDAATNVVRLQQVQIFDEDDSDQTGIRVYTVDDTKLTAAWGQDPDTAPPGNPFLDMGSAILPFPTVPAVKQAVLWVDHNTNNVANPGDELLFCIHIENVGFADAHDVVVFDSGASNTIYTLGSATLNGTTMADDVTPPALSAFPFDEQGYNIGDLALGATAIVEYVVTIEDPFPTNAYGVINGVFVEEETQVFVPVPVYGFDITKTSTPTNPVHPLDMISYAIDVAATANVAQAGVRINDNLPPHTTWVPGSTRISVPGQFSGSAADEFLTDSDYNGSEGALVWATEWQEQGESDGPGGGDIQVAVDSGAPATVYMLRIQNALNGAYRMADLAQFTNLVFSYEYRRDSLDNSSEYVDVEVSSNGGGSWTLLQRIGGAATDPIYAATNFDISAFAATNTAIRFYSSSSMSSGDRVWFDNIEIAAQGYGVTNRGSAPPVVLDHYQMGSNDTLHVTFDATVDESVTVTQIVNWAYVSSYNHPDPAGAFVANTVILPPRSSIGGQVRYDGDGDGDLNDADAGITNVTISLFSDPNGDGEPSDGALLETTSTDATGAYVFTGRLADNYVVLETDPAAHLSTGDRDGGNFNMIAVTTVAGEDFLDLDFLDTQVADISGQVRNDTDGDAYLGDADTGIPGVTVTLFTDPNGDGDPADGTSLGQQVTDGNGDYTFTAIDVGSYVVVSLDLAGYLSTADRRPPNDNRVPVTMAGAVDSTGNDFLDAASGLAITKTSDPPGIWYPDLEATYTIVVENTGVVTHTGIDITDFPSAGITYVNPSTRVVANGISTNTFRDQFGSVSYGNNDGSENWSGNWVESDNSGGGASGGAVRIDGGRLRITDGISGSPSIERSADLSGYSSAELSFDYDTSGYLEYTDEMDVDVSTDGSQWTTLMTFQDDVSGSTNIDITAFMSASTWVRFRVAANYGGGSEYFYADDVQIRGTETVSSSFDGGAVPLVVTNYTLSGGGRITITMTGRVGNAVSAVGNQACVSSDQMPLSLCDSVQNTVYSNATPDRISGQVRHDPDGDGDLSDPDEGLSGVTLRLYSDPNGDGHPGDGTLVDLTVTDPWGYYLFGNLGAGDYVVEEADPPGFSSTADSYGINDNRIAVNLPGGVDSVDDDFLDMSLSGLLVTKEVLGDNVFDPGQLVTYAITITNTRALPSAGIAVYDPMAEGLAHLDGSTSVAGDLAPEAMTWRDGFYEESYSGSEGSEDWQSDWDESGDDNSPESGDLRVYSDQENYRLQVRDDNNRIERSANILAAETAELNLKYRRQGLEYGEYAALEIRAGAYGSWVELDRFGNNGQYTTTDGTYLQTNYNITAYISDETTIRFSTPSGGMGNGDIVYFDDIEIVGYAEAVSTGGADPPYLLQGGSVAAHGALTITYTAEVGFVDEVINEAWVTSAGDSTGVYASVTSGVAMVSATQAMASVGGDPDSIHLAWTAVNENGQVLKAYDALYVDRNIGFEPGLTSAWARATTVTNSFFVDHGGEGRPSPFNLGSAMRFYRAARTGRWPAELETRVGSREVYVAKCLSLLPGENWVSLMMVPDKNSLASVLGTNRLPAGPSLATSTRVEWYGATVAGAATNVVWLSDSGVWLFSEGGVADDYPLPLNEGFNIVVPNVETPPKLLLVGKVPTNAVPQTGQRHIIEGGGKFNVVSYNLPYRARLGDVGLREAGFMGAPPGQNVNPNNSDELRILRRGGGSLASPLTRILMDHNGQFVFWTGGNGSAEDYRLQVDDALLVYTKRSPTNFTWNVNLPYLPPSTRFNP